MPSVIVYVPCLPPPANYYRSHNHRQLLASLQLSLFLPLLLILILLHIITRPTPPGVNLDPEPAAPTSPATDAAPQCSLPCCDTSTSVAARLVVDKERTAQGEGKRKR